MDANAEYLRLLLLKHDSVQVACFKNYANHIREQPLCQTTESNIIRRDIIPVVNTYINGTKAKRAVGLVILRRILPQCSADILSEYAFSWMQHCCKWNAETANEELKVLRVLIVNSSSYPDIKKQVISFFLPQFVDRLINHRSCECAKTVRLKLKCLRSIIDSYSSSCGPYSNEFKKFVILCMKQFPEQKKVIREAALCFVCLSQWSGKKHQGVGQKELWASQLDDLIAACHTLFDSVYSFVGAHNKRPKQTLVTPILDLSDISSGTSDDPVSRFHCWKANFTILSELIQYMFLCKCSVHKTFKPNDIFSLICRLLAVNGITLENCSQTTDVLCLNAILPDIHALTFDILRSLIRLAKRNLISYGSLICKLCLQSLKWTQPAMWTYGTIRPFETLRCKVLTVLSEWLSIAGSSSSIEIFADEIISLAILNIEFLKPDICLTPANQCVKGKRKKREHNVSRNVDSVLAIDRTANKNTCVAAHLMLQSMIRNNYSLIKWEHHKVLQYTVISLLLPIVGLNTTIYYPLPYSNVKCRLQLFATLYTLTKWPHWKWKKLVSLTNRILTCGRNDDYEISSFCTLALAELEVLTHPPGPSLAKSFLDNEINENSSRQSSLTLASSSVSDSRNDVSAHSNLSLKDVNGAERLVLRDNMPKSFTVPTDELVVDQIQVSTATETICSSQSSNVCSSVVDSHSSLKSTECGHPSVPNLETTERRRLRSVQDDGTSSKKPKIEGSVVGKEDSDSFVASMLSDFVDTLQ